MTGQPDRHGIDPDDATRAIDAQLDQEPSIERLLSDLGTVLGGSDPGWNGIETTPAALQKQRTEATRVFKREANVFRDTFSTPAGRECLEIMKEMTLRSQPYPPEAMLPIDAITALCIAHNAQSNFVWSILQAIAQADNREAKPRNFSA